MSLSWNSGCGTELKGRKLAIQESNHKKLQNESQQVGKFKLGQDFNPSPLKYFSFKLKLFISQN